MCPMTDRKGLSDAPAGRDITARTRSGLLVELRLGCRVVTNAAWRINERAARATQVSRRPSRRSSQGSCVAVLVANISPSNSFKFCLAANQTDSVAYVARNT